MVVWLTIPEYPNYEVSSNGYIRNKITGKQLSTWISNAGYKQIRLGKSCKNLSVHRLVARTFYDCTVGGLVVNHLDGNKKNNFIGNLEWCTSAENLEHAARTGLRPPDRRGGSPKKKVRLLETGEIFESITDCARSIKGDKGHIAKCLNGTRNTHKGYHFEEVI